MFTHLYSPVTPLLPSPDKLRAVHTIHPLHLRGDDGDERAERCHARVHHHLLPHHAAKGGRGSDSHGHLVPYIQVGGCWGEERLWCIGFILRDAVGVVCCYIWVAYN